MILRADRLSKQYGNGIAVDRVSFELREGVTGLLGANGAGKTTLMRMLTGVLMPTSGAVDADGIPASSEAYRALLGYLPQDFGYYPEFTVRDFVMYFAALKGLDRRTARRRTEELLERVGLSGAAGRRMKTLSGGMRQRAGIAQALVNDPRILILDEPTAGLDPGERVRFRKLIREIGGRSIVLFSTHIVSDVEHIADHVMMMKAGRLIWRGKWDASNGSLEEFYMKAFGEDAGHETVCDAAGL
ncbi:MAG: ATP-binding cassette domain-containing protein [Clostridia bacterium]|nr:ATP-binding cassette domain-containing protein [Clostridia bacterium]